MGTHDENQSPPRTGINEFAGNIPLVEAVHRYDANDAFIGARLGESRGSLHGVLPAGTDPAAILARH